MIDGHLQVRSRIASAGIPTRASERGTHTACFSDHEPTQRVPFSVPQLRGRVRWPAARRGGGQLHVPATRLPWLRTQIGSRGRDAVPVRGVSTSLLRRLPSRARRDRRRRGHLRGARVSPATASLLHPLLGPLRGQHAPRPARRRGLDLSESCSEFGVGLSFASCALQPVLSSAARARAFIRSESLTARDPQRALHSVRLRSQHCAHSPRASSTCILRSSTRIHHVLLTFPHHVHTHCVHPPRALTT